MKRKMYTLSHDIELLKQIDNDGNRFTSEEHSYLEEKEFGKTLFESRRNLIREESAACFEPRIRFLIEFIKENNYSNILSMGAGSCINEYFIKMALPDDTTLVVCDFDSFYIKKAKDFFADSVGLIPKQFDFFNDDIHKFIGDLKLDFDLATFFSSSYVMDDEEFQNIFSGLKETGIKNIIDFHGGFIDWKQYIRYCLAPLTNNTLLRSIFGKPQKTFQGKFHGYARSKSELRNLYSKSGWEIDRQFLIGQNKTVAVSVLS